jgi:hypothetical protein
LMRLDRLGQRLAGGYVVVGMDFQLRLTTF